MSHRVDNDDVDSEQAMSGIINSVNHSRKPSL